MHNYGDDENHPKEGKHRLKDWRPLIMLLVLYKLIAKLLALRFSPHSKFLVRPQQTGFILERFILENVSLSWMTHDWVVRHKVPTLILKLDFGKAFDRVEHPYIWAVVEKVGLGGTFLKLVQGLLAYAISRFKSMDFSWRRFPSPKGYGKATPSRYWFLLLPHSR